MASTVLITGANRGLGLEFVKQYIQDHWHVIACCRNPNEAKELQKLATIHPALKILKLDVCDDQEIVQLTKILSGIPIDILINNAGIAGEDHLSVETVTTEEMVKVFLTNTVGPLQTSKALFPNLMLGNLKIIANISSRLGSIAQNTYKIDNSTPNNTYRVYYPYRASKVALNMVMKTLSLEWDQHGIRVLLLHPGWVKTDMGGSNAPIETKTSVGGLRKVILEKSAHKDSMYHTHEGAELPW